MLTLKRLIEGKVDKTGDTMTGALTINNLNEFDGIKKRRKIGNTTYGAKLGVGANGCLALETTQVEESGTETLMGRLEVGIDGKIRNDKTKQYLLESEDSGWINGTLNSGITLSSNSGFQYGNGIQARIKNGVLFVRISVSKSSGNFTTSDGEVVIGTLPSITGYDLKTLLKEKNFIRAAVFGTTTSYGFLQIIANNAINVRIINGNSLWLTGQVEIPLN